MNREDDTIDLLYDDGDFESHVPRERLHAVSIELTDRHACSQPSHGPLLTPTVFTTNASSGTHAAPSQPPPPPRNPLAAPSQPPTAPCSPYGPLQPLQPPPPSSGSFHSFCVGDVVKVDLKGHGAWYTGRVIAIDTKFRVFTVKYQVRNSSAGLGSGLTRRPS